MHKVGNNGIIDIFESANNAKNVKNATVFLGNYIHVDTDFILTTIQVNFDVNFRQFKETFFVAQMNAARCIGGQNKRIIISITCGQ